MEPKSRFELKGLLKAKATILRNLSLEIRKTMKDGKYAGKLQNQHSDARFDYRCHHIAYCLLRGRKYSEIEANVSIQPSDYRWELINKIKHEYSKIIEWTPRETANV